MRYNQNKKDYSISLLKAKWARLLLAFAVLLIPVATVAPMVYASGDGALSLSPSSGSYTVGQTVTVTVSVFASAGDNANAAQANVSFSGLSNPSVSVNSGIFNGCVPPYSGSYVSGNTIQIPCAILGNTFSGTQTLATISFTASSAGSASVSMQSGSDVQSSGNSIFNGSLPAADFTVNAQQSGGGGTTGGSSGSSGSSGAKSSSSGSSINSGAKTPITPGSSTPANPNPLIPQSSKAQVTAPTTNPAGTAAMTITVTNGKGKPIEGAKVSIDNHYIEYTNAQGKAGFSGLAIGTHNVVITAGGEATSRSKLTLESNDDKQVVLKLASDTSSTTDIVLYIAAALVILGGIGFTYIHSSQRKLFNRSATSGIIVGSNNSPVTRVDTVPAPPAASQATPSVVVPRPPVVQSGQAVVPSPVTTLSNPSSAAASQPAGPSSGTGEGTMGSGTGQ